MNRNRNLSIFSYARKASVLSALSLMMGTGIASAQNSEATWERVLQTNEIRVGTVGGADTSKINIDGSFTGLSPETLRQALSAYAGTEITLVPVQMEFASLIPALLSGRIDVIANTLVVTGARCEQVAFADPDFRERLVLIVHPGNPKDLHSFADIAERDDTVLAIQQGGLDIRLAQIAGIPTNRIALFPDYISTVSALQLGRADAASLTSLLAMSTFKTLNNPDLELADPYEQPIDETGQPVETYYAMGFRPGDDELREAYNMGLAELRSSGSHLAIIETAGGDDGHLPPDGLTADKLCADLNSRMPPN